MNGRPVLFALLCTLLWVLAGCATQRPAPVTEQGRAADAASAPSGAAGERAAPQTAAASSLLASAIRSANAGDLESASATLERSLRIEPNNPLLWSELATVRLRQGQPAQAEQLAVKSNALAAADVTLQIHNWRLIAEARRQRGELSAAKTAELRARDLQRLR